MSKTLDDVVLRALLDDKQEVVLDREGLRPVPKVPPTVPTPRPQPVARAQLAPTVD